MDFAPIEELFTAFDETARTLQEELSCTYLDALGETGENFFHGKVIQEEVSEISRKRLDKVYSTFSADAWSPEDIRKAFQLAILKGMKENIQPNHQMTPDAVGMLVSYLIEKFTADLSHISIMDPAVGTGNLLFTVLNQLSGKQAEGAGSDVDETLIRLAYAGANLQKHPVQFFNQDSLEPLFLDPVDVVVSDLPVGYYPNDVRAAEFELAADSGHSYSHHLFIEQSLTHTKEGGYLFFVIPNQLFVSPEAPKLNKFLTEKAHIQGMVQLPLSMFKNEAAAKSILILQKKGEGIKAPRKALLASLPKLSNAQATQNALDKINDWFREDR